MSVQHTISRKITPLESMRGLAALMVFLYHYIFGFMPQRHGQESATAIPGGNLIETPFFSLINGPAAVTFFFVLSGFVLSYSYFNKGSNDGLAGSVIKRWPRLFPLALLSTIFSWLMINYGLYSYSEAANITKSQWMARFAYSTGDYINVSFSDAFKQGFFYTFFRGDANLNTSLWTMHYEFIGSLLVFGLIPLLNGLRPFLALIMFIVMVVAAYYTSVYMCAFVMGTFLSYYRCQVRDTLNISISGRIWLFIGLAAVFFIFGYLEPARGFYNFINEMGFGRDGPLRIIIHTLASVILIQLILNYQGLYNLLDGRVGRFLGRCSFSLYVIHVPLMFSFSTYFFLLLLEPVGYRMSVVITFVLTLPLLFFVSWLMALLDEFWCKRVNRIVKKIV